MVVAPSCRVTGGCRRSSLRPISRYSNWTVSTFPPFQPTSAREYRVQRSGVRRRIFGWTILLFPWETYTVACWHSLARMLRSVVVGQGVLREILKKICESGRLGRIVKVSKFMET